MSSLSPTAPELVAAVIFAVAVLHTFSVSFFSNLAHRYPKHAGFLHFLSEVEAVFGMWAFLLIVALFLISGKDEAVRYLEERSYTEPMFVLAIMVVAASRPLLPGVTRIVGLMARILPMPSTLAFYFLCLSVVPLLGSFITEPAAMTLAAILLRDAFYTRNLDDKLQYATVGVLFVNVSIGGTLTHFAAPPVLMVAAKWQWDTLYMLTHFGWKFAVAVFFNAAVVTWMFHKEIIAKGQVEIKLDERGEIPFIVTAVHLFFLTGVVIFAHHPAVFMGLLLFFIGYTQAYNHHQDPLFIRGGMMVAFFLAGLVTLGGLQQWWLQAALADVNNTVLYYLATALTAITDNAALTYLGSLVEGVSDGFKYALVAGAVTGGGLTVIANAPNPAGFSILKGYFRGESISPLYLFLAAFLPTVVAILAFQCL